MMLDTRHAAEVVNAITARLRACGGELELYQLDRFSIDELAILVRLEVEAQSLVTHKQAESVWAAA